MIVGDESWKVTSNGPIRGNNEFDGEDYDALKEMPGWEQPGLKNDAWQPAKLPPAPGGTLAAQKTYPSWSYMIERGATTICGNGEQRGDLRGACRNLPVHVRDSPLMTRPSAIQSYTRPQQTLAINFRLFLSPCPPAPNPRPLGPALSGHGILSDTIPRALPWTIALRPDGAFTNK